MSDSKVLSPTACAELHPQKLRAILMFDLHRRIRAIGPDRSSSQVLHENFRISLTFPSARPETDNAGLHRQKMPLRAFEVSLGLNGTEPAMHTDRKIGFAMGILLIGIVAALFFRNEPLVDTSVPTVRRERELNERLRERDVAVYLNDDKQDPLEEGQSEEEEQWTLKDFLKNMGERKSLPTPVGSSKKTAKSDRTDTSWDGFQSIQNGPGDDHKAIVPITPQAKTAKSDPEPGKLPPLMSPSQSLPERPAEPTISKDPAFDIPEEFDEYIVKYGDTLSGIAQKMLGSQSRYQEIYEANRDRMSSPDRLDVGKPLRIPRIAGNEPQTQ